jgi:nucleotide-binding universal stress UspA family protein
MLGDDGSPEADRAWLWINLQRWPTWRLDVVHCQPPPPGPPVGEARARPHPWQPPSPREPSPTAGFESVRYLLAESDPRIVLTDPTDASLVVIGRKGHGALKALHLGSTAEYVVQHPSAPVVIAKKPVAVGSVLVCTDGSTHAQRAVDALVTMPWLDHVHTLTVIGLYLTGTYDDRAEIAAAVAATIVRLEDAPGLHCAPASIVRQAKPSVAIPEHSAAMSADLVVLGTRGLSAFERGLLWGSTARTVIKTTESSVLVAHAGQSSRDEPDD